MPGSWSYSGSNKDHFLHCLPLAAVSDGERGWITPCPSGLLERKWVCHLKKELSPGPELPLQGWGTEDKRSQTSCLGENRNGKTKGGLKGTKCGPGSKAPRSSAHSVLTPGLESYFVWPRLTLWGLATSFKRLCALGHMLSNQFSLFDPFLSGCVVPGKRGES